MTLINALVISCSAFGVLAFIATPLVGKHPRLGILLALDFWTAAGLLRLTGVPEWRSVLVAGLIIVIRKVTSLALKTQWVRSDRTH